MTLEVEFITLGDASNRLGVPAPTLRHWTDQLEEFDVHYVLRNNRNERTYEASDLKVFEFLRDLKAEHGRKTTTKDLGYMITKKGEDGDFVLRTREDVPEQTPSNRTMDLLNNEDIKKVLESDRAKQVVGYLVSEATKNIKAELIEEVRLSVRKELSEEQANLQKVLMEIEERRIAREDERSKYLDEREKMREERDREARIKWEEEQQKKIDELMEKLNKKEEEVSAEDKPKSWIQKLLGQ